MIIILMSSESRNNNKNNHKNITLKLKCDKFDPSNIVLKNMSNKNLRMLYPTYKISEDTHNSTNPIIIETPYITLKRFPLYLNGTKPIFNLYNYDDGQIDEEMKQIFDLFLRLDNYTKQNISNLTNLDSRIKSDSTYSECVRTKLINGGQWSCIKLKLNLNLGEINSEQKKSEPDINSVIPVIKVYYKSGFKNPYFKIHSLPEINKILRPGKRVRFILAINKLWFNEYGHIGYGIKIMQMEIDDVLTEKFRILKSLKTNDTNMFDNLESNNPNIYNNKNKYNDYLQRKIIYGSTKLQKQKDNEKIINIIKANSFDNNYLFNDKDDEYVPLNSSLIQI